MEPFKISKHDDKRVNWLSAPSPINAVRFGFGQSVRFKTSSSASGLIVSAAKESVKSVPPKRVHSWAMAESSEFPSPEPCAAMKSCSAKVARGALNSTAGERATMSAEDYGGSQSLRLSKSKQMDCTSSSLARSRVRRAGACLGSSMQGTRVSNILHLSCEKSVAVRRPSKLCFASHAVPGCAHNYRIKSTRIQAGSRAQGYCFRSSSELDTVMQTPDELDLFIVRGVKHCSYRRRHLLG
jgi:hypothetical protein